ncbi:MAG: OmpA family protein, partial [Bacteroidota bacterium]
VCDGDEKWREIEKLSFCSAEYNYMHPAVSPDGQYLFFVSNKPRGEGGTDIYWAKRQEDGSWGKAESVGAVVNTPSHEGFPFFTNNGELFFCSKGHVGYGGFDIFMTRLQADNSWSIPVNLGQPINSSLDDISIYLNENQTRGIFTSSRNGGDDDIYLLEVKPVGNSSIVQAAPARPLIQNDTLVAALRQTSPYVSNDTLIQIATPVSSEMDTIRTSTPTVGISIDSTSTVLAKANTDVAPTQQTEAAPEISIISAKNTTGRMMSEIPTLPLSDGTGIGRVSTTSTTTAKQRVGANRPVISSIAPGPLVRLSRQLNRQDYNFKQQIVLPRINYKADAIDPDNYETLDRLVDLLREYPKVEIELGAHTLADRQEAPRRTLTEKRAYTAAAYLVEQGVATWRIVPRGYGSSRQGTDVLTLKILAF